MPSGPGGVAGRESSVSVPSVIPLLAVAPSPSPAPREAPADAQAIFRVRTNVVTVRAVVRDAQGRAVADIPKDEFELADNGQPQTISSFSMEGTAPANAGPVPPGPATNGPAVAPTPDRYVMYVLDDLNLSFGDLSQTRAALQRVLAAAYGSASRVAVLTTSGRVVLSFTSDPAKVNETLNRITPQGRAAMPGCPSLSYYLADRIVRFEDKQAIALATRKAQQCHAAVSGERTAELAAIQAVSEYRPQMLAVLAALKVAARRMSILPGSRTIVLVTPGFITPDMESEFNSVIESAVRAGVVINTLDARGVRSLPGFDAATAGLGGPPDDRASRGQNAPGNSAGAAQMNRLERQFDEQAQQAQSDVLTQLAAATGGAASGGNDFEGGFRRLTAAPEVSYVLGFMPENLKADGSYHKLKVTLATRKGLTVQARNGNVAPRQNADPAEQAKEEIENALLSRDEIRDIPVTLGTEVAHGKLTMLVHFGIGSIRFIRQDGHNRSSLTANLSLFDADGNYVKGVQDIVDLDFSDDKLASAMTSGQAVKADFDMAAGSYVVRLVLRDGEGHMSSTSRHVEMP